MYVCTMRVWILMYASLPTGAGQPKVVIYPEVYTRGPESHELFVE